MCLVYNKHATDFLIEKHILNSYYVRVELEELAGEEIPGWGRSHPRSCHYYKVVNSRGHQSSWPSKLPVSQTPWRRLDCSSLGAVDLTHCLGADSSCQGGALLLSIL